MKKLLSWIILASAAQTFPTIAAAAPIIDRDVEAFLQSPQIMANATLPVLVVYKRDKMIFNVADRARLEKEMQRSTANKEAEVFQSTFRGLVNPAETLWIVNGSLTNLSREQIQTLQFHPDVQSISFSKKKWKMKKPTALAGAEMTATYGLKNLKLPELLAKYPTLTGTSISVGILDTGIDASHPDLKGKLLTYKDFSSEHNPQPVDGFGHGTHVAGTIAGGSASGQSIGVAPNVKLIVGRIFDAEGNSETADIIKAMQWIADPDGNPSTNDYPRAVNNSWGDDEPYKDRDPENDPFCNVVDSWVKLGIIPVFSAGNSGSAPGSTGLPAGCPQAFAVGATDINDRSPWFSSAGPAMWKSVQIVKPEIAAPGMDVYSTRSSGGYQNMSGTSMSSPHITGAFALLLQAKPSMTVQEAEQALIAGAQDLGDAGKDNDFGWGRPDLLKSIDLLKQ